MPHASEMQAYASAAHIFARHISVPALVHTSVAATSLPQSRDQMAPSNSYVNGAKFSVGMKGGTRQRQAHSVTCSFSVPGRRVVLGAQARDAYAFVSPWSRYFTDSVHTRRIASERTVKIIIFS